MSPSETVLAALADTHLTLAGLLGWLRTQGRLGPLVREALAARLVQEQAAQAGLSVTDEEVQTAADDYRRQRGLKSAADTHAWLAAQGMSADDLATSLEQALLAAKLRQHMVGPEVERHFAAHQADFERLRFALVLLPREDLARELASQVRDEGRDLADVTAEQSLRLERQEQLRKELSGPVGLALSSARLGELVGPLTTPRGFALVGLEACQPAELDSATRRRIQDELFAAWLAARLREATLNLAIGEKS